MFLRTIRGSSNNMFYSLHTRFLSLVKKQKKRKNETEGTNRFTSIHTSAPYRKLLEKINDKENISDSTNKIKEIVQEINDSRKQGQGFIIISKERFDSLPVEAKILFSQNEEGTYISVSNILSSSIINNHLPAIENYEKFHKMVDSDTMSSNIVFETVEITNLKSTEAQIISDTLYGNPKYPLPIGKKFYKVTNGTDTVYLPRLDNNEANKKYKINNAISYFRELILTDEFIDVREVTDNTNIRVNASKESSSVNGFTVKSGQAYVEHKGKIVLVYGKKLKGTKPYEDIIKYVEDNNTNPKFTSLLVRKLELLSVKGKENINYDFNIEFIDNTTVIFDKERKVNLLNEDGTVTEEFKKELGNRRFNIPDDNIGIKKLLDKGLITANIPPKTEPQLLLPKIKLVEIVAEQAKEKEVETITTKPKRKVREREDTSDFDEAVKGNPIRVIDESALVKPPE